MGLIPVFPSLTFPNHYSIVTGLYPAYHGIINNHFIDPKTGEFFHSASHETKWWLGEPLWETVVNHGLKAATNFWPGSEVKKGSWNCPEKLCMKYNGSVPFEDRVDTALSYCDLPSSEIPAFMTLYFEDPDHQGHKVGPDDPQITKAVARIDRMIGRLIDGLEKRGILEDVTIIMVGDHGMVGTCDKKLIFLEDLAQWIEIPAEWVLSYSPLLAIRPPPGNVPSDIVARMNQGLESGKVDNGKYLKVYLKEDLPSRLNYAASDRIPPTIGLIEESFKVEQKRSERKECRGSHGYDNAVFSMRSIFIGHGPEFGRGKKMPSFENVEIYNLVHATISETSQPKWWERNAGPNMVEIHSTEEFLSALNDAGDRLVIVEFYGTWCASCKALFPKLCKTVQDHLEILFLKVDFDENKAMCKSLNVRVLPYFHFYHWILASGSRIRCLLDYRHTTRISHHCIPCFETHIRTK